MKIENIAIELWLEQFEDLKKHIDVQINSDGAKFAINIYKLKNNHEANVWWVLLPQALKDLKVKFYKEKALHYLAELILIPRGEFVKFEKVLELE